MRVSENAFEISFRCSLESAYGLHSLFVGDGRLARNRESARQCRRRKKEYLDLLQDKVTGRRMTGEGGREGGGRLVE